MKELQNCNAKEDERKWDGFVAILEAITNYLFYLLQEVLRILLSKAVVHKA